MQQSCTLKEIDRDNPNNAAFELVTIFVCFLCLHIYLFSFFFENNTTTPHSPPLPAIQRTMRLPLPQLPLQPQTPPPPLPSMPMAGRVIAAAPEAGPLGSPWRGKGERNGGGDKNVPGPGGSSLESVGHCRHPLRGMGKSSLELPSPGGRGGHRQVTGGNGDGNRDGGGPGLPAGAVGVEGPPRLPSWPSSSRDKIQWRGRGKDGRRRHRRPARPTTQGRWRTAMRSLLWTSLSFLQRRLRRPRGQSSPTPPATAAAAFGCGARRPRARQ